jgi:hypothetical protein
LTAEFVDSEIFEPVDAFSYFGEEGRVCGENVERMLVVVDGFPWDEQEVHAWSLSAGYIPPFFR